MLKRETGASPVRSRHCERRAFPLENHWQLLLGREGKSDELRARRPAQLLCDSLRGKGEVQGVMPRGFLVVFSCSSFPFNEGWSFFEGGAGYSVQGKRGKLVLVTGGARSGKSNFAEGYAAETGKKVVYIATATGDDEEMLRRIEEHRKRRSPHFMTVEEPYFPHRLLEEKEGEEVFFLLDCLTLLMSNHLLKGWNGEEDPFLLQERAEAALEYVVRLLSSARRSASDLLVVTNEVGMGVVPDNLLGRFFRDLAGRANQLVAAEADEVWLLICGIGQRIK